MATREQVVSEARRWLGTPFVHQARVRGHGCDCVGLPIGVARSLGLLARSFDVGDYARLPDGRKLLAQCDDVMTRIARKALQPGDVILVRWGRAPQHLGIVAEHHFGGLSMIHAHGSEGRGGVVEQTLDAAMQARVVACYRLPGVAP